MKAKTRIVYRAENGARIEVKAGDALDASAISKPQLDRLMSMGAIDAPVEQAAPETSQVEPEPEPEPELVSVYKLKANGEPSSRASLSSVSLAEATAYVSERAENGIDIMAVKIA